MTQFHNQKFHNVVERETGAIYDGFHFSRCEFIGCAIGVTRDPTRRSTFRNCSLEDCEFTKCNLDEAFVEDSLIFNLRSNDLVQAFGATFKHVVVAGRIDRIMFSSVPLSVHQWPELSRTFEEQNKKYYGSVDWALDISRAEFKECTIRGLPAHLIRRDPETQIIITKEAARRGDWKDLDLQNTYWPTAIELFLEQDHPALVLVAPKRAKDFKSLLKGLDLLREAGIAEPD